ncbi:hypothetical protein HPB49_011260 [Dermacentor silvarum]|uniref:Uncharacterized protein n=1 Tax=Dermacentor silvarum TaxID=543639 RepID=A0ACB8D516_DERSI|nr:hypothetical protein HPB49_011260 [Dermacentor silvarum]
MTANQEDCDADMRSRAQWSEGETHTLIRVWQDHLGDLRRTKRNAKVYAAILEELGAEGIDKPLKTIKSKIENLGNKYRTFEAATPFRRRYAKRTASVAVTERA